MNALPPITIVICTYDRLYEIEQVIKALSENLYYPIDKLTFHIADDNSPTIQEKSYVSKVEDLILAYFSAYRTDGISGKVISPIITSSITNRQGWGANVNKALSLVKDSIIYFTEDDYVLKEPIDLTKWVTLLQRKLYIGMIRFGIEGHTGLVATIKEARIINSMSEGTLTFPYLDLALDQGKGTFGFYRYSNRPHLRHVRFSQFYGKYAEGQKLGKTEEIMNTQIADRYRESPTNAPAIICPLEHIYFNYDHIGHSRQHTAEDI
jgi:glycosyltransferase involved in cell wall biosynthesis